MDDKGCRKTTRMDDKGRRKTTRMDDKGRRNNGDVTGGLQPYHGTRTGTIQKPNTQVYMSIQLGIRVTARKSLDQTVWNQSAHQESDCLEPVCAPGLVAAVIKVDPTLSENTGIQRLT